MRQLAARVVAVALLAFVAAGVPELTVAAPQAQAGTLWMTACSGFGDGANGTDVDGMVWQGVGNNSFSAGNRCGQGGSFQILPSHPAKTGESAQWHTVTPPSIQIVHAVTPVSDVLIDPNRGDGFKASFFWSGGSQSIFPVNNCCGGMDYGAGINRWLGPSRYFGWQATCTAGPCGAPFQILDVRGVELVAVDNTPPRLLALGSGNLWYEGGHYVRGAGWPASFQAGADDGICGMQAILDGQAIQGPNDPSLNQHSWTQCPSPVTMPLTIDTTKYPDGPMSLTLSARDAASPANISSPTQTLAVDNQPVGLSLSGPTDAPSSAGTQYVTATATAGPSQIAGIACSQDGSPYQWHPGASAQIPVTGLGEHQAVCYAQNNAADPYGNPARSSTQSWSLKIGVPTVMGIAFTRIVDALRCRRVPERIKLPAHWVTVHRHHKPIHVRRPVHFKVVKVTRCHPRTALKQVTVWKTITRHGKKIHVKHTRIVRVVLLPHVVNQTTRRVRHGHASTVDGWLGTTNGTALSGQTVAVLTAADNGRGRFRVAATVTTAANGSWQAKLPPGPSRVIEAFYGGAPTLEGAVSGQVRLIVPARVRLIKVSPRRVAWGQTVHITGQLQGGYLPSGGALVRMRIGQGTGYSTYGVQEHVTGSGRFSTTYTFGVGDPGLHRRFWFQLASLPIGNYPYAPAASNRINVTVGGHPPPPRSHRHQRHKRKHIHGRARG